MKYGIRQVSGMSSGKHGRGVLINFAMEMRDERDGRRCWRPGENGLDYTAIPVYRVRRAGEGEGAEPKVGKERNRWAELGFRFVRQLVFETRPPFSIVDNGGREGELNIFHEGFP